MSNKSVEFKKVVPKFLSKLQAPNKKDEVPDDLVPVIVGETTSKEEEQVEIKQDEVKQQQVEAETKRVVAVREPHKVKRQMLSFEEED
jgi:hypothetical protein